LAKRRLTAAGIFQQIQQATALKTTIWASKSNKKGVSFTFYVTLSVVEGH
jgi:hypothetical protein